MDLQKLQTVLEQTFASNFVSYYRSHTAHIMTTGRNFYQDHKLLENIYEYFQGNIDTIGEKLRTVRASMPPDLYTVINLSPIADVPVMGDSIQMFEMVLDSLEMMIDQYHELNEAAEAVKYIDIANFAQDQIASLAKFRWMVESTLEK